jgi:hypothetical protein
MILNADSWQKIRKTAANAYLEHLPGSIEFFRQQGAKVLPLVVSSNQIRQQSLAACAVVFASG